MVLACLDEKVVENVRYQIMCKADDILFFKIYFNFIFCCLRI